MRYCTPDLLPASLPNTGTVASSQSAALFLFLASLLVWQITAFGRDSRAFLTYSCTSPQSPPSPKLEPVNYRTFPSISTPASSGSGIELKTFTNRLHHHLDLKQLYVLISCFLLSIRPLLLLTQLQSNTYPFNTCSLNHSTFLHVCHQDR